jgi:hypothetical protein
MHCERSLAENYLIKDRKSPCQYQNNLPAAQRVFHKPPCQKSYGRKTLASNYRYGWKIPTFWSLERDFLHFLILEKSRPENPSK